MKLYTLDYNCNLPVTQQVNVATNTDAKIGIKVQKNGEYLNLDGSTLTIETPEVITPDPIDVNGNSLHIVSQLESLVVMTCPLSAVVGDAVKATSLNFEKSADDSTWLSAAVTGNINYIDTAISGNSALAQCNVSQGQTKWTWIRTPLAGQTTDTVPATATSRLQWAGLDTSLAVGYWRLNCVAQGKSYHATISADAEPTNGYVTFPISTPDTASLVQDTVIVNKESIVTEQDKNSKMPPATPSINKVFTSDIIPEGMLVMPDVYMQYGSSELSADGQRITGYAVEGFRNLLIEQSTYAVIAGNSGTVNGVATNPNKWYLCKNPTAFVKEWDLEHPLDYVVTTKPSFVQTTWQRRYLDPQPTSSDTYMFFHCSWKTEETKAKFKLNVNTFKSQLGDKDYIGELPYIPSKTVNIAGTYTDNTSFSYDVYYKD